MTTLQKYLFDVDFGTPSVEAADLSPISMDDDAQPVAQEDMEEAAPPPPAPTFTEEDLSLVRDQAYESGRQAGAQEGQEATERLLATSLATIGEQLAAIGEAQRMANQERLRDALDIALAVVKKVFPETAKEHAADEVVGVVTECLDRIDTAVKVTVRAHPDTVEDVRARAEEVADACAFEGKLVFAADGRIAPGDCRVEWGDGGAERDQGRLWREVDALIARAKGEAPAMIENDNAVSS